MTTLRSVAQFGARDACALVAAHGVSRVACAHKATISVVARLAADTFRALVSVQAGVVVSQVQRVTTEAEALCLGALAGRAALVTLITVARRTDGTDVHLTGS